MSSSDLCTSNKKNPATTRKSATKEKLALKEKPTTAQATHGKGSIQEIKTQPERPKLMVHRATRLLVPKKL